MRNIENTNLKNFHYREELVGLRGIAIISVIVNHINPYFLPSGYLGVDIFFIISGYVITLSLDNKNYSELSNFIIEFYERRIKRLLPTLIVYSIIISFLILLFNPYSDIKYPISSLFGLSNIYLYMQSNEYFTNSINLNPFANTWSLSVEQQFYLIYPFILWYTGFAEKKNKSDHRLLIVISALSIASFISFIFIYPNNQNAAYYLFPMRFWEIGIGSILYIVLKSNFYLISFLKKIKSIYILLFILVTFFLPIKFSVAATILINFLTFCLIYSIKENEITMKILLNQKLKYIGLISYSLYLWHWGTLSISRWTIGISWWTIPIQLIIIFALSKFSFKYIECFFRKK